MRGHVLPARPAHPALPRSTWRGAAAVRGRDHLARLLAGAEYAFAVVALLVVTEAVLPLFGDGGAGADDPVESGPVRLAALAAVYAGTALLAALHGRRVLVAALRQPLIPALVALAFVSAAWSAAPGLTLKRSLALAATTLLGLWLGARYSPRALMSLVAAALGLAAALSLGAGLLLPEVGLDHRFDGAWRGVFGHKNGMGKAMVLAAVLFALLAREARGAARLRMFAAFILAAALVLLSRSTSALVALAAMLALLPLIRAAHRRSPLVLLGPLAAACVAAVVVGGTGARTESVFAAFGKDATLTGRTELWEAVLGSIGQRTALGYGYGGFWHTAAESESLFAAIGWRAWHAHNAFLDLWLNLGLVGLVLFVAALAWTLARAVRAVRIAPDAQHAWPLALLAFLLLTNLTESRLVEANNVYWVLLCAVACAPTAVRPTADAAVPADPRPPAAPAPSPALPSGAVSPGVRWRHARAGARATVLPPPDRPGP
jgi:exopolysaccharide production protein ExoQ